MGLNKVSMHKILLTVSLLSLFGCYADCTPIYFEATGKCLFLQPNATNLHYAVEAIPLNEELNTTIASPNWTTFELRPDYQFGFEVGELVITIIKDFPPHKTH